MNNPPIHELPSGFITSLLILLWLIGSVASMLLDMFFIPIYRTVRGNKVWVPVAMAVRDLLGVCLLTSFMAQLLRGFDRDDQLWLPMEFWVVLVTCQITTLADALAQWKLRREEEYPIGHQRLAWVGTALTVPLLLFFLKVQAVPISAVYGWFQSALHWLWGIPWLGLLALGFGDYLGLRDLYAELKFILACAHGSVRRVPVEEWRC